MIDIEKFICSLLADHPEGVAVRGDIHRALKEQGLEYKDGKIVPIEDRTKLKESEDEKIRKKLISLIEWSKSYSASSITTDEANEMISWLEKQGESVEINPTEFDTRLQASYQTPDEIIEECYQDNANHIIDIVTEQRKPAEWSDPYNGVSFVYNNHTWGMCARDNGVEILIDSKIKAFISLEKSFIYPTTLISKSALEAIKEEKVDNANKVEPTADGLRF